jgi:hypothetical protein
VWRAGLPCLPTACIRGGRYNVQHRSPTMTSTRAPWICNDPMASNMMLSYNDSHQPIHHRHEAWDRHLSRCADHDDARGVYGSGASKHWRDAYYRGKNERDIQTERQGEVRLHRHALRPRTSREDLRPRRRAHQDAGNSRTEVRRYAIKNIDNPSLPTLRYRKTSHGLRREDQPST